MIQSYNTKRILSYGSLFFALLHLISVSS